MNPLDKEGYLLVQSNEAGSGTPRNVLSGTPSNVFSSEWDLQSFRLSAGTLSHGEGATATHMNLSDITAEPRVVHPTNPKQASTGPVLELLFTDTLMRLKPTEEDSSNFSPRSRPRIRGRVLDSWCA